MRIHIIHTGKVHVSPNLPFGGENCSIIKASGMLTPKNNCPRALESATNRY